MITEKDLTKIKDAINDGGKLPRKVIFNMVNEIREINIMMTNLADMINVYSDMCGNLHMVDVELLKDLENNMMNLSHEIRSRNEEYHEKG